MARKKIIACAILVLGLNGCGDPRQGSTAKHALAVAETFATSIACDTTFETKNEKEGKTSLKDVVLASEDKETGELSYYVLWGGDVGCSGGSGSYGQQIIEVARTNESRPLLVVQDNPFRNLPINIRFTESISSDVPNFIEIISWDYADQKYGGVDGGNNFPANKFKYELSRLDAYSPWEIQHQSLLEQQKN